MSSDSAVVTADAEFEHRKGALEQVQHLLHRSPVLSPLAVLVMSSLVFTLLGKGRFQDPASIGTMLQATAVMATLAIGQTLVILTAGVDLAVGTAMLLTHLVIARQVLDGGWPPFLVKLIGAPLLAMAIGVILAMLMGLFHGWLVTKIALPAFIVTLGTFYIYQSLGNVYGRAQTIDAKDLGGLRGLLMFMYREIKIGSFTINNGVVFTLLLYVIFAYVLAKTAWGRHVYATGDDREAARLAGVDTRRVLLSVYVVAGLIYGLAAWVQLGRSQNASMNGAADVNLQSITAVVIGGTSLFGGRGRLWGTLVGALIVAVFDRGLSLTDVNQYYKNFAIGVLILVAVALDQWIRKVGK
jgi:fructose transport system permease protein